MVLNEREINIIEKLYYEDSLKIQDISSKFNVSERMIRYNISRINQLLKYLKLNPIVKNSNGEYTLKNKSVGILKLIKELEPIDKTKKMVLIKILICYADVFVTVESLVNLFGM